MENTADERCWLEIDLDAISFNVQAIRAFTGRRVLAIVKANGCGHGAVPVSLAALAGGAEVLGVGTAQEALELLDAGIESRILVLGFVPFSLLDEVCCRGVEIAIWNAEQRQALARAADRIGRNAIAHVYVDVNMGRFGAPWDLISGFVKSCLDTPQIDVKGLMGHLPSVDERPRATALHIARFADLVHELDSHGIRPSEIHLSNSSALSYFDNSWFDMVRAGVVMYGVGGTNCPMELRPSMAWKARILDVQVRPAGFSIGYGSEYVCEESERIVVIGVGYADGYRRIPKNVNSVLSRGKNTPVVGRLCTQHCMAALPISTEAHVGDEVVLLGSEAGEAIRVEDLALRWQTNAWDVFCGISSRIPRVYWGQNLSVQTNGQGGQGPFKGCRTGT